MNSRFWIGLAIVLLGFGIAAPSEAITLLDMSSGARPLGMGGAFVSMTADAASLMYNPAGLAFLSEQQISGYAARPFGALDHLAFGLAAPHIGLTVLQLSASGALETNVFGNPTGRPLDYVSRAAVAGLGYELLPGLAVGAQIKAYLEENGPVRGFGWALDPAVLYTQDAFSVGAVWRNLLNEAVHYDNGHQEAWVSQLTLGGSWLWAVSEDASLRFAADVEGLLQTRWGLHLGTEVWLKNLALRAGWDRGLLTFGASVKHNNLQLHWAYAVHETLPQTVRLSASVAF